MKCERSHQGTTLTSPSKLRTSLRSMVTKHGTVHSIPKRKRTCTWKRSIPCDPEFYVLLGRVDLILRIYRAGRIMTRTKRTTPTNHMEMNGHLRLPLSTDN